MYERYQQQLTAYNAADFEELLIKTAQLVGAHPLQQQQQEDDDEHEGGHQVQGHSQARRLLGNLQRKYCYILVDEYQVGMGWLLVIAAWRDDARTQI